jgi:hypothetical protein
MARVVVRTNTSGQIRWRANNTTGSPTFRVNTWGYVDLRGKDA